MENTPESQNDDNKPRHSMFEIPVDRGYAWIVLLGAILKELIAGGLIHMVFGVMYLEVLEYYSANPAATAWVGSATLVMTCFGGPIATHLAVRWSVRTLGILATLLFFTGLISSMFLPSPYYLYLTWSTCLGIGNSLVFLPSMGLLKQYFDRHLGMAMGFGYIGTGIGQMVGPPLFVFLVDEYGLRGTLLIWAGIQLNMLVCALLMQPTHFYTKWHKRRTLLKSIPTVDGQQISAASTKSATSPEPSKSYYSASCELLKNRQFIRFSIAIIFGFSAFFPVAALMIPAYADQTGLPRHQVALLSTCMGAGATIGRPLLGFIADRHYLRISTFYAIICFGAGFTSAVYPHVGTGMAPLGAVAAISVFCSASLLTLSAILLKEIVPMKQYTLATGWMGIALGIPHTYNYSLFVYISEKSGSWNTSFYICGCCFLFAGIITLFNHRRPPGQTKQTTAEVFTTRL